MIDFTLQRLIIPEGLKTTSGTLGSLTLSTPGAVPPLRTLFFFGFLHHPMDGEKQAIPGMHGIEKDMYMFTRI
jgi:hypothetical protein